MLWCQEMWYSTSHGGTGKTVKQSNMKATQLYQKNLCQRSQQQCNRMKNQAVNRAMNQTTNKTGNPSQHQSKRQSKRQNKRRHQSHKSAPPHGQIKEHIRRSSQMRIMGGRNIRQELQEPS